MHTNGHYSPTLMSCKWLIVLKQSLIHSVFFIWSFYSLCKQTCFHPL